MKTNIYTAAVLGLLFIMGVYNAYSSYQLMGEVRELSLRLDSMSGLTAPMASNADVRSSQFILTRSIPIVAVSSDGEGISGNLTVKLIPGNNNVLINTNPFLDADIQYSVNKAVAVAKLRSPYEFDRDFIFDFQAGPGAQLIGGESAGAAATVATIAALQNRTIRRDTAITGTIETDGTVGEVGGIIEKAKAVSDAGYRMFLVPRGQSVVTYYERQISEEPTGFGFKILNTRYVPRTVDLKKVAKEEWNLEISEVSTIDEALDKMLR